MTALAVASELKIARGFALPLDVVTEAVGIIATRGAGKSYGSVVIIEEAFAAGVQTVVLDPTGVYHGLRSSADGDKDGLAIYVFGGVHGDLPLEDGAGSFLADLEVLGPPCDQAIHDLEELRSLIDRASALSTTPPVVAESRASGGGSTPGDIPAPQQKILDALAWYEALGVSAPSRVQVAMMSGYRFTSGGYKNLLGRLSSAGLISYPASGFVALTPEGRGYANEAELPNTNEGVQQAVLARLPGPQQKILRVLIAHYPNALSREELADATDYSVTSGGFKNLLGRLSSGALIGYPQQGYVAALDVLFPMG